jgi:hypothetical protein
MTALCILLALSLGALLFSRIHFHFSFDLTISKSALLPPAAGAPRKSNAVRSGGTSPNKSVAVIRDSSAARRSAEADLSSALINLGCEGKKAQSVAKQAMEQGKDFDTRLKWALSNAA